MSDGERIVVEFRDRAASAGAVSVQHEFDPGEAVVCCHVCGYYGVVDDDPKVVNADRGATGDRVVCQTCDSEGDQ